MLRDDKYESQDFGACGYKWKLVLYPYGNFKRGVSDHISLYLAMEEAKEIHPGSQVEVILKFFVYDHIRDKFLTIQYDRTCRYHSLKTENGFDKLISLELFEDCSNGYLVDDCCLFGIEVNVINNEGKGEKISIIKEPKNGTFTWKIENFSAIQESCYRSEEFTVANLKWRLLLYPKGDSRASGKSLSLFLELLDNSAHPQLRVFTKYNLMVKRQLLHNHRELTGSDWFTSKSSLTWGFSDFMPLSDIHNLSKTFLVKDSLIVEAKITLLADVEGLFQNCKRIKIDC
ncbi:hypothetical protein MANES_18G142251v8 [Manihot esculenta]|uniref:Uncharacterized protein n=1 Tax=Manihot esculenta TaxID=3983 RepID=A0ACB7G2Q6_MANES|nr:hypothetical protein MANES_18G142251v8 [Manihot esculenta]